MRTTGPSRLDEIGSWLGRHLGASAPQTTAPTYAGYVVDDRLGDGATGTVWRAHPVGQPDRMVALKQLKDGADRSDLERLRQEGAILALLDHPHIVKVLEVVDNDDGVVVVMEHAAGGSLEDLLAHHGPLSVEQAVAVVAAIADAASAAHREGVVHGDIKPSNILFTADGKPLLADFGVAQVSGPAPAGAIRGTPGYLAPEVLEGASWSAQRDVYSLGVVCYEAIVGVPPHVGESPQDVLTAADSGVHLPLRQAADVPAAVADVAERAIHRQSELRYADAQRLSLALREALGPRADARWPVPAGARAAGGSGAVGRRGTATFGPRPVASASARSGPPRRLAVAACLAALLVVSSVVLVHAIVTPDNDCPAIQVPPPRPGVTAISEDMDGDGCKSVALWANGVLDAEVGSSGTGSRRLALGKSGDEVLIGDWDCDDVATPSLYRPPTGELFYFNEWGRMDEPLISAQPLLGGVSARPSLGKNKKGCDEVELKPVAADGTEGKESLVLPACAPALRAVPLGTTAPALAPLVGRSILPPKGAQVPSPSSTRQGQSSQDAQSGELAPGTTLDWSFALGADAEISPSGVVNDTLYLGTQSGSVCAISASTGEKRWQFDTPGAVVSPLLVTGGLVFVSSRDGHLYALDAGSGEQRWVREGGPFATTPVVANGVVYVGSEDGHLDAVEVATGVRKWSGMSSSVLSATPLVVGESIFAGGLDGRLHAFDTDTGGEEGALPTGGPIESSPVVVDNSLYIGSNDGNLWRLELRSGGWSPYFRAAGALRSSPTVVGSTMYFGDEAGQFNALSTANTGEGWVRFGFGPIRSRPAVGNRTVYFGSGDAYVHALDAASGENRWRYGTEVPPRGAVVVDGRSIFATGGGVLHKLVME